MKIKIYVRRHVQHNLARALKQGIQAHSTSYYILSFFVKQFGFLEFLEFLMNLHTTLPLLLQKFLFLYHLIHFRNAYIMTWSLSETGLPGIAHTTGSDHHFSTYWLSGFGLISDWMVGALYLLWRLSQCI